jgi:hypothetical protein
MDFGKVDSLRSRVRHGVSTCGCDLRGGKRGEHFAILKAQNSCALTHAREAHVARFTRKHEGGRTIGNRCAVIEPQGRGDQLAAKVCLARDRALKLRRRVFRSVTVVFARNATEHIFQARFRQVKLLSILFSNHGRQRRHGRTAQALPRIDDFGQNARRRACAEMGHFFAGQD